MLSQDGYRMDGTYLNDSYASFHHVEARGRRTRPREEVDLVVAWMDSEWSMSRVGY